MNRSINDFMEDLKCFESNMDSDEGINHLSKALACIKEVLNNDRYKNDRKTAENLLRTSRNKVLEEAPSLIFPELLMRNS